MEEDGLNPGEEVGSRETVVTPSVQRGQTTRGSLNASDTTNFGRTVSFEDFQRTEKALHKMEVEFSHQVECQTQKDAAQDELLEMQFDSMKREIQGYVNFQALEEQKAFITAKVSNNDIEMKEAMRTLGAAIKNDVNQDARKLQEQLDKINSAVITQIKKVDQRLKENSESDAMFEQLVRNRLAAVEAELGIESPDGGDSGQSPGATMGGQGGRAAKAGSPKEMMQRVEARVEELAGQLEEFRGRFAELESHVSDELDPTHPSSADGKVRRQKNGGTIQNRISTLEDMVDDMNDKAEESNQKIQELEQKVDEAARPENPLDWLEERVGELAKKRGGERVDVIKGLEEVAERMAELERKQEEALEEMKRVSEKAQQDREGEESERGSSGSKHSSGKNSGGQGGKTTVGGPQELTYVNLFEDMERLRSIIECMEQAMPHEVQHTISFFKGSHKDRKSPTGTGKAGGLLESKVLELRNEADEQAQRVQHCEEIINREFQNVLRAVRGVEREQDQMKTKVDELWHKFPELLSILMPLQVHVQPMSPGKKGGHASPGGASLTHVEASLEGLKPLGGLMEAALKKSIAGLQHDVAAGLSEVKSEVNLKANAHDLSILRDRVERNQRSPSPTRPTLASYKGKALSRQASQMNATAHSNATDRTRTPGGHAGGHDRCKTPTYPMSQSAGRLPVLSKTR